jgi:hypothetical protein
MAFYLIETKLRKNTIKDQWNHETWPQHNSGAHSWGGSRCKSLLLDVLAIRKDSDDLYADVLKTRAPRSANFNVIQVM